jgi:5-methylcytosine-specific restriction endonuclease McrA
VRSRGPDHASAARILCDMARRKSKGSFGLRYKVLAFVLIWLGCSWIATENGIDKNVAPWLALVAALAVAVGLYRASTRADRLQRADAFAMPASQQSARGREPFPPKLRFEVLKRDGFRCRYCGRSGAQGEVKLHVDHVVPVSKGGTNDIDNLVTACEECNLGKSNGVLGVSTEAASIHQTEGVQGANADPLLGAAVGVVQEYDRASASLLQRRLKIGYARAAQLIEQLEAHGYIGPFDGSNARQVLPREVR